MMENKFYTSEKNALILIALLKQYGIKRVIASPGTGNMALVVSMQHDSFFLMYSSVDERSAAYMACGMAAETNEPVVITCTEATASRNYLPGLTEAFYRKLPVLAIMANRGQNSIGSYEPQSIDNSILPNDVAKYRVNIPTCQNSKDELYAETRINEAINNLYTDGGGPVCISLESYSNSSYCITSLPSVRVIKTYNRVENLPVMPNGKIAILVGAHSKWTEELTCVVDNFCEKNNAAVLCDLTSNYNGKYRVNYALVAAQEGIKKILPDIRLVIYIGTVSGDYYTSSALSSVKEWWMVSEDGKYHDRFSNLTAVITTKEIDFFGHYLSGDNINISFYNELLMQYKMILQSVPEDIPFSNIWVAKIAAHEVPDGCVFHAAINNSYRAWNFFTLPLSVTGSCNVGGFGIDGGMSTLIGASLVNPDKIYYCVIGDLAFFYDMNVLGNRHIGQNVRVLLINNGKGQEFRNYQHPASLLGKDADEYVAAGGHYGPQSRSLVKGYAESLGYKYISAASKDQFLSCYKDFFNKDNYGCSIVLEVFTNSADENEALYKIRSIIEPEVKSSQRVKHIVKEVVGEKCVRVIQAVHKSLKEKDV